MDPFEKRELGKTGVTLPALGFGGAPLGELFEKVSEHQANETLNQAYNSGIRYYDTAPWYGHGLSEHRLGSLLRQKNRKEFVLSSKVGRVYSAVKGDPELFNGSPWAGGLPFEYSFDYSADGFERSYMDSTLRSSLNRIELLVIHDLDHGYHGESVPEKLKQLESGVKWLNSMKASGEIKGFGAGINEMEMIPVFMEHFDLDFFLVAMPYTLLDQSPLDKIFPECKKREIGIIIGSPYASGVLAVGSGYETTYGYAPVSREIRDKVKSIEDICAEFNVPLKAAALQFPLLHPLTASVIPGVLRSEQVLDNIKMIKHQIPPELWLELKQNGLLHPEAPVY
ncbi:MAG: Pyridoxal 4-dehydrogenase [Deltaproteobacteria bacterium]|nr:Pyridoxal 4-dehydrogenase [Deltaproteobacteria bacterium]